MLGAHEKIPVSIDTGIFVGGPPGSRTRHQRIMSPLL